MVIYHEDLLICPYRNWEGIMSGKREIACGVDIHGKFMCMKKIRRRYDRDFEISGLT
jgi:hypothetical protein